MIGHRRMSGRVDDGTDGRRATPATAHAERRDEAVRHAEAGRRPRRRSRTFAASWVPPWARSPAGAGRSSRRPTTARRSWRVGRLAYGDAEDLPNPDDFEPGPGRRASCAAALEAILLVVDEPVSDRSCWPRCWRSRPTGSRRRCARWPRSTPSRAAASTCGRSAGGWRLYTRAEYAPYVERFVLDGQQIRLTQAALETLAVVAYKQPVTRSRVAAIRGVNCDGVIKTLVTRGLVEECGTEQESGAHLYRTTTLFLEKIGHQQRRGPAVAGAVPARQRGRDRPCPTLTRRHPTGPADRESRRGGRSGCRRCWPRPGSAPGGPARS